jgi:ribonucleoside-diphosphate reductase beta chain
MSNVFNTENTAWKEGKYPLFLGQAPALYDSVNVTYPKLFSLYKLQKSIDWAETEVSLEQSRIDMANCSGDARELMIENICYQWEADSIAARSIAVCFGPFITNSEYWAAVLKVAEIEVTHSLTYSEIVRQCIPDPTEVFERILNNEFLDNRMRTIGKVFHDLKIAGAKYTLGLLSDEEAYPIVMNGLVALYCLERLQFMDSFAITFGVIEDTQQFIGIGQLVAKIAQDEFFVHQALQGEAIKIELQTERGIQWRIQHESTIADIVREVHEGEHAFNRYIFEERGWKVNGLSLSRCGEWIDWNAKDVYELLYLPHNIKVNQNPLKYMEHWLNLDAIQNANQETNNTNYVLNSVIDDVDDTTDFGEYQ